MTKKRKEQILNKLNAFVHGFDRLMDAENKIDYIIPMLVDIVNEIKIEEEQ